MFLVEMLECQCIFSVPASRNTRHNHFYTSTLKRVQSAAISQEGRSQNGRDFYLPLDDAAL